MKFWRAKWVSRQFVDIEHFRKNRKVLAHPAVYYLGLALKCVPGLFKRTLTLVLRTGDIIKVREFSTLFIYSEIFLDGCYDLPLPENPVVVDVGANTGLFALRIKRLYPHAAVFCYEPYPPNFAHLGETISINNLSDVQSYSLAVTDQHSKIKLYIHPTNIGGHSILANLAGKDWVEVETLPVSEILSSLKGKPCDLLKLDCQGAEYPIIKSLSIESARRIHRIIFEPTDQAYDILDVRRHLECLGYDVRQSEALWIAKRIDS